MVKSFRSVALAAGMVVIAGAALAQDKPDKASQKFITEAIQGNFAEVQMGQLAQKNAVGAEIKSFGQMLITDHNDANVKAIEAAKAIGVNPPTEPNAKQKAHYEKLSKIVGAAFDKAFAQHMLDDHKKEIRAYRNASKKPNPAGQYARATVSTLQKHLETAQSAQKKIPMVR